MAAINETAAPGRRPGFARQKKTRLRIDMTPMVDLGFLLITFFIFTTSMGDNKAMDLCMPDTTPVDPPNNLADGLALTLLIGKNNTVYYYNGRFEEAVLRNAIRKTNYSVYSGIGDVIRKKQKAVAVSGIYDEGRDGIMLLMKPLPAASYRNIVDALDEVLINDMKKYAIVEPSPEETAWMESNR